MATILRGARVFDGTGFTEPTDIAIDSGRIVASAPAGADIVDAAGGYLLPGFIDSHIHLRDPETLTALAKHGVTTALDMSSPAPLVQALRGTPDVTDIRSGMMALTSPDSAHAARMRDIPAAQDSLVAGVTDAAPAVERRIAQGADYVKIVIDLPGFEQETVDAIVSAAHARDLKVVTHASRSDAVAMAQLAGADVLTHVPLDRPIGGEQASAIAAAGTVVAPTLIMMKQIVERLGTAGAPGPSYEAARESVRALHDAGVTILASTDANETPAAPASPAFGTSFHDELELLVEAGLTPADALRAATSAPADYFAFDDRGRIEPGLRADLVLLDADPTVDIAATRDIRAVWIAGERVKETA